MLGELVLVLCQSLWNSGVSANLATSAPQLPSVHPARARDIPWGERLSWSKAWYTSSWGPAQ